MKAIIFGFLTVTATSRSTRRSRARSRSIGGVTATAADPTAKNAYFLNGSQTSVLGPFGTYTQRFLENVKTVAIVYPNQPGRNHGRGRLEEGDAAGRAAGDVIAIPPLATDLLGAATQASSADMIVAAARLHRRACRSRRAIDQIRYTKPILSTPICTSIPRAAYAGGDLPQVDLRHRPDAREPAGPAVEALPEEGPPVRDERQRHALGLLGRSPGRSCSRP